MTNTWMATWGCATILLISSVVEAQAAKPPGSAIDSQRSTMTIRVFRSGVFSFAGDNHEIRVPIASGSVNEQARTVQLRIETRSLEVLDPHLSPEKRAEVQKKMLSPDVLDPDRFPVIQFQSTSVEKRGDSELLVHGRLTLHGETHIIDVKVTATTQHYKGTASLKQTDFGMRPVSVAGGTVKVKDEVTIEFDIVTQ